MTSLQFVSGCYTFIRCPELSLLKHFAFLHALAQNSTATKSVVPSCVAKAVRSRSTLQNARNQEKWKNHKSASTVETRKAACLLTIEIVLLAS